MSPDTPKKRVRDKKNNSQSSQAMSTVSETEMTTGDGVGATVPAFVQAQHMSSAVKSSSS